MNSYAFLNSKPSGRPLAIAGVLTLLLACGSGSDTSDQAAEPAGQAHEEVSGDEVRQEIDEALTAVENYAYSNKRDFEAWADNSLTELDGRIEGLEQRGAEVGDEAREAWEETLADLRQQRSALDARLDEVRNSSADAWDELSTGFQQAQGELSAALDRAAAEFGGDDATEG